MMGLSGHNPFVNWEASVVHDYCLCLYSSWLNKFEHLKDTTQIQVHHQIYNIGIPPDVSVTLSHHNPSTKWVEYKSYTFKLSNISIPGHNKKTGKSQTFIFPSAMKYSFAQAD